MVSCYSQVTPGVADTHLREVGILSVGNKHEVVVVGGGVAGCTAALYSRRYALDVVLLEKAAPGGLTATASHIENYPGFPEGISGVELAERVRQQAANAGVKCIIAEVRKLQRDNDAWLLETSEGDVTTPAVIIATGASPRKLNVPGESELRSGGVSYCATCDGFFYRDRVVAVVGGGNTAVDEAIYLSDIATKVYLIHRRDELRAEAYLQQRAFARDNIEFVWNSIVTEILGSDLVEGVRVYNKKTDAQTDLAVDGVFIAIGHVPNTGWLGDLLELKDGFIITDKYMATSQPGIFAAGDVRDTPLRQITTAVGDAAIAAYSAYQYVVSRRG